MQRTQGPGESMDALLLKLDAKTQRLQDVEQLRSQEVEAHRVQIQDLEVEMDEAKGKLALAEEQGRELTSKLHVSEVRSQQLGNELKAEQQRSV